MSLRFVQRWRRGRGGTAGRFLLRRLWLSAITLVLVSVVVFAVAEVLPGDVGRTILGPFATNEQVERLNRELGLERPLVVRYAGWLGDFVRGEWGDSFLLNTPVRPLVVERAVNSVLLGAFALAFIVPVSIGLGVLAALYRDGFIDRAISVTGLSLIALPEFVVGVIVLVIFAVELGWFPVSSQVPSANPVDVVRQFFLPSIPLMLVLFGYIARMARAGTVEALASDYVRTAVLKGLSRWALIWRHVLRNALLPTISVVSVQVGYLFGGLVVVETLFNYPGIGKLLLDSAVGHDLPVLEATVLVVALLYMLSNLVADSLYAVLNPRIRVGR
ncbi:ABC transporter permease [soil metagenome]|nr:ABC transporter permease [Actinomycetota bacterium]MDQ3376678.1 ABC transporter permease [Actinomycetota bacterium]